MLKKNSPVKPSHPGDFHTFDCAGYLSHIKDINEESDMKTKK